MPETPHRTAEVTRALRAACRREPRAEDRLLSLVYDELRMLSRSKRTGLKPGQTLQTTALVHEAWIRVSTAEDADWESRAHFFGAAARAMRNILVDQTRRKRALKRGGGGERVGMIEPAIEPPAPDVIALDESLRLLEEVEPRQARVVGLRFFAGLSVPAVAEVLQVSVGTVERDWRFARAWLQSQIEGGQP